MDYIVDEFVMLKDLDLGLYKLAINNYFSYLMDPNTAPQPNLVKVILKDNSANGLIKYYSDLTTLLKFADTYHELIPTMLDISLH